jgi:hypothetical protein
MKLHNRALVTLWHHETMVPWVVNYGCFCSAVNSCITCTVGRIGTGAWGGEVAVGQKTVLLLFYVFTAMVLLEGWIKTDNGTYLSKDHLVKKVCWILYIIKEKIGHDEASIFSSLMLRLKHQKKSAHIYLFSTVHLTFLTIKITNFLRPDTDQTDNIYILTLIRMTSHVAGGHYMTLRRTIGRREDCLRKPPHPLVHSYWSPGSHSRLEYTKTPPQTGWFSYFLIEKSTKQHFCDENL